mgnify:CR=1 FL=1
MEKKWWHKTVGYQIYPKSFQDTDGDGTGDIRGIISRLDYLKDLGIDAVWISPMYRSPQDDNGYDISDYQDIDPMFGTLDDMDELIARILSLVRRYTRFNQSGGLPQQLDFDGLKVDIDTRSITPVNGTFELPPKEFDLLLLLAKYQGKILTKQRIYEEVWGEEYCYDDSNIMAIISRLRKKLEENTSKPKYIQTVKGIGYRFNKEV